jgi:hypothetical protein
MVALKDSPRGTLPSGTPLRHFLNPRLWPQGLAYLFIYLVRRQQFLQAFKWAVSLGMGAQGTKDAEDSKDGAVFGRP